MIDLAMKGGDLIVSPFGDISLHLTDDDNVIQTANLAITIAMGENIFHDDYGNDALNKRLKIAESGFHTIEIYAKEAILHASSEVAEVASISASKGEGYGECTVAYTLVMMNGRTISSSTSINIL